MSNIPDIEYKPVPIQIYDHVQRAWIDAGTVIPADGDQMLRQKSELVESSYILIPRAEIIWLDPKEMSEIAPADPIQSTA